MIQSGLPDKPDLLQEPSPDPGWASSKTEPPSPRCTPMHGRPRRTAWVQIVEWTTNSAPHRQPGAAVPGTAAYLDERDGDQLTAARLYAEAARSGPSLSERDHLTRQVTRLNARMRS